MKAYIWSQIDQCLRDSWANTHTQTHTYNRNQLDTHAQHLIFGKASEVQHLETPAGITRRQWCSTKQKEESAIQANEAACGTNILLKIYPGKPGDMLDTTAISICGSQPQLLSPVDGTVPETTCKWSVAKFNAVADRSLWMGWMKENDVLVPIMTDIVPSPMQCSKSTQLK